MEGFGPLNVVNLFNEVLGREVAVPDHPTRIICLSPAITETLFLLGLGERIIGVSAFCARPDEAQQKKKVGSYSGTNVDQLREMRPDLILAVTGYQRNLALALSREFSVYPLALPISVPGIVDVFEVQSAGPRGALGQKGMEGNERSEEGVVLPDSRAPRLSCSSWPQLRN